MNNSEAINQALVAANAVHLSGFANTRKAFDIVYDTSIGHSMSELTLRQLKVNSLKFNKTQFFAKGALGLR